MDFNKYLNYRNGKLYWKVSNSNRVKIGDEAGTVNSSGYLNIGLNNKNYLNHRIIFAIHNGYIPKVVDHINGFKTDNRIENLREATRIQNGQNMKLRTSNKSGCKNVSWHKPLNKWKVSLRVNNKVKHIGYFLNLELADLVAVEARNKYHLNFANHG